MNSSRNSATSNPSTDRFQPFRDSPTDPNLTADNTGSSVNPPPDFQKTSRRSSRARSETAIRYNLNDHSIPSNNEIAQMAARLKQRRETSSGMETVSAAHYATNPRSIQRARTLDDLQSFWREKAAEIETNVSSSHRSHVQDLMQSPDMSKAPDAPLSGVAALRARFEKG